ncbi:hypothetical protein FQZ97_636050 [compost metagenome]
MRPDAGIRLHGTGYQVRVVGGAGVHAFALDLDGAAFHAVALQRPAVDDRLAGGEGGAVGVDEAAAVAGDAGRVGDDELRAVAGHFDIAPQLAGVAGVHLVQDDAGRALAQPRVALHPATQLCLRIGAGVVEDGALLVDVELLVGVARDAGGAGRLDVHQGHAVGGLQDRRALVAGRVRVGHDLGAGHRDDNGLAERERQGEAQGIERDQEPAARGGGASGACAGSVAACDLCHDLEQAQRPVENDAVEVLVHAITSLACA